MNFPVNERKLREDLHEAIDKESMINVIILLMLIRVVQVITWLRPGERELPSGNRPKTIKASNVTVTLDDGTEVPAIDGTGPHSSFPAFAEMVGLNTLEAAPDPFPGLTAQLEAQDPPPVSEPTIGPLVAASMEIESQTIDRDMNLEFDVAQSTHEEPETGPFPGNPERMALVYRNLAFCVTDCGEIQVLHRTWNRSLRISVYEGGREEEMEIPKIPAAYMAFLVEQDDASRNRLRARSVFAPGAIPGLMQDYTRDHFGRPVTGQQVLNLAHALDAEGPIDLGEHVGMSLQFSDGLRIQIEEGNLGYCQALAEQERAAVTIENAIALYRHQISHSNNPQRLRLPMDLAWAKTPGNEVATLEIGTDGVLITGIIEKTPKEAAPASLEISMTHLRILYENDGYLHSHLHPSNVSGYCTPSRGRPWTGGSWGSNAQRDGFPSSYNGA